MGQNESPVVSFQEEEAQTQALPIANIRLEDSCKTDSTDKEQHSKLSTDLDEKPICRICHCSSEDLDFPSCTTSDQITKDSQKAQQHSKCDSLKFDINDPLFLITPCFCTGTLQFVHHKCLQQWIRSSNHKYCELCKYNFKLKIKNRPIYKWECLNMSKSERRKLLFHLAFNFISMICVFWSIYVIAERATHELVGQLGWRFWLKMLVVTIGFICGIMFIFFQLKLYISILLRWKQYNQIVIIENVKDDQLMSKIVSSSIDMTCVEDSNKQF